MTHIILLDEDGRAIAMTDGGAGDLAKSLATGEPLLKSHVKGYTRSDGAYVAEHDDKRQAATPHFGAYHHKLAASSKEGDLDHETNQTAAAQMRAGDADGLKSTLRHADTDARDHILDHIHPDHWEGLGFRPLDHAASKAKFEKRFGEGEGAPGPDKAKPKRPAKVIAKKGAKDPGAGEGGDAPAVKTANPGMGFHGGAQGNYVRSKHGPDTSPFDLSEKEQRASEEHADKHFAAAAKGLVDKGHFKTAAEAGDFLDSRYGRHLADEQPDGAKAADVKWLPKAVERFKKEGGAPITGQRR